MSVHHYELAPTATGSGFLDAVAEAVDHGLFESIPGLVETASVAASRATGPAIS